MVLIIELVDLILFQDYKLNRQKNKEREIERKTVKVKIYIIYIFEDRLDKLRKKINCKKKNQ